MQKEKRKHISKVFGLSIYLQTLYIDSYAFDCTHEKKSF